MVVALYKNSSDKSEPKVYTNNIVSINSKEKCVSVFAMASANLANETEIVDTVMNGNRDVSEGNVNQLDVFTNRLHNALDFYQLFDTLINELKSSLNYDSIEYDYKKLKTTFVSGKAGLFRCKYALSYENSSLGSLCITSSTSFQETDLEFIEDLLAGFIFPLNNVLRYQEVINDSKFDELTGLNVSDYLHDLIELEIRRAHYYQSDFSLLVLNLDDFEGVNQQFGRHVGDTMLAQVAKAIVQEARSSDSVYRKENDEFVIFLTNTNEEEVLTAAKRIKTFVLSEGCVYKNRKIEFSLSIGVTTATSECTASEMVDRAKQALLKAKGLGKNRICENYTKKLLLLGGD